MDTTYHHNKLQAHHLRQLAALHEQVADVYLQGLLSAATIVRGQVAVPNTCVNPKTTLSKNRQTINRHLHEAADAIRSHVLHLNPPPPPKEPARNDELPF